MRLTIKVAIVSILAVSILAVSLFGGGGGKRIDAVRDEVAKD
jgi:hypothetical protein